jgi:tetratricopeptide (TPR) repeat protein
VGLLTAHGDGYYSIHPALPWFFNELFGKHYPDSSDGGAEPPTWEAERAFVEAMGELGNYYHNQYEAGNRDVIGALTFEEANLLHARRLARQNGWWRRITSAMQGLRSLYGHTGRRAEWKRLVEEIVPDFVDPETDGPLPEREEDWSLVTQYRVRLAREERDWKEAERLQRIQVEWSRERAAPALEIPAESLDDTQRNDVRSLGASLHELGQIQREMGQAECVKSYEEAVELLERIGDNTTAATCAFNLGNAYTDLPDLRDLDQAERWYQRDLELEDERDHLGRARCLGQLGYVAWERFDEAREAEKSVLRRFIRLFRGSRKEPLQHLNQALERYLEALEMFPKNAVADLAVAHNQLGGIYYAAGQMDRALYHYNQCIQYDESMGDVYGAGQTRCNVVFALWQAGRFQDALSYARAALRNFETYGNRAAEMIQKTKELIAEIEVKLV